MSNLSIQNRFETVFQHYGMVVQINGNSVGVRVNGIEHVTRRATSCLLEPGVGDKVLFSSDLQGSDYILAVLERAGDSSALLSLPPNTEIHSVGGSLSIFSTHGLHLKAGRQVSVQANHLQVEALQGDVAVQNLSLTGEAWRSCVDRVKSVGRSVDSVLERCISHVRHSYRTVEELDQVKAGQIDYTASETLQLHAKYVLATADQLVKLDGEQIHLG